MVGGAVGVIAARALTVLAGPIIGIEALGFFSLAFVFSMLPMSKVMPIVHQSMFPAIAKVGDDAALKKKYLLKTLEFVSHIIFPIGIGMSCLSEHVVSVIFGDKWLAISFPLAVLSALSPIRLISQIFHAPLNALGHARVVTFIQLIALAVLAGGAIKSAEFGLMGLVWLTAASVFASSFSAVLMGNRILQITLKELGNSILPATVCSFIMASILFMLSKQQLPTNLTIQLAIEFVVGVATYSLSAWLLFNSRVKYFIKTIVN
jgi:O-antigen/teichoic acid export membrane protein